MTFAFSEFITLDRPNICSNAQRGQVGGTPFLSVVEVPVSREIKVREGPGVTFLSNALKCRSACSGVLGSYRNSQTLHKFHLKEALVRVNRVSKNLPRA